MMMSLLFALACTGEEPSIDDSTVVDDTSTDDTGEEENLCEPKDQAVDEAGVYGTVTDRSGAAIECLRVQFCGEVCVNGDNNGDGEFSVVPESVDFVGAFTVFPLTDTYKSFFQLAVPMHYVGPLQVSLVLQPMDNPVEIPATAAPLTLSDEITLTLGADNFQGDFSSDNTIAGAVLVPPSDYPPLDLPGEVLALHYLAPFHGHSEEGLELEVFYPNATDSMVLYEYKYDAVEFHYEWAALETTAGSNSLSAKLHYVTTLAVVQPALD